MDALACMALANVASSMSDAITCTRQPFSGNQVSNSELRNVPGRWAMASAPSNEL